LRTRRFVIAFATLSLITYALPVRAQFEDDHINSGASHPVASIQDAETAAQRDARMRWWREARFGMFIHWGLYAVPAGTWNGQTVPDIGEWIMNTAKVPVADYEQLAARFNPTKFDADAWVGMAKAAGMKYIIITAKHHDGFAMFKSNTNSFNIVDATPFKRDPLKELAVAAHKQRIKLGFYYSQDQDWTAAGGVAMHGGHWDKAQDGDFSTYIHNKVLPQINELLTNYRGEDAPDVIWFDTPTDEMTPDLAGELVKLLNQHPKLIWNNRLGSGYAGDTETPEQQIPPRGYPGKDWETCMTMNDTWGYRSDDTNFKSTETMLHNLIDVVSKGGNYLLNVGPDATGAIPPPELDRLLAIGNWLRVNGEAIYGSGPTPFGDEAGAFSATEKDSDGEQVWVPKWDWRATTKPGKLYVSLFKWPGTKFRLPAMKAKVSKAYMLADPKRAPLKVTQDSSGIVIELPASAPDALASELVLETHP
jgi:alpha-L-fucosidase